MTTILIGCYHPTVATDVPCGPNGTCPSGQRCNDDNRCTLDPDSIDASVLRDAAVVDARADSPADANVNLPRFRAHSFVDGDTTTTTIQVPSDVVAGDLLIAHVSVDLTTAANVQAPAGWTKLIDRDGVSDPHVASIFYRYATAGTTSYTWTFPTVYNSIALTAFYNVRSSPFDAFDAKTMNDTVPPTAPSITTTVPNTLLLVMMTHDFGTGPFAMIPNMTQVYSTFTGNLYVHGAYARVLTAGPTGDRSTTTPDPGLTIGISVALAPSP